MSSESLRARVRRSASAAGPSPSASRRARMKRSIGFRTQASFFTAGGSGRVGGMNDQCGSYSAPSAIHRFSSSFCSGESVFFRLGGGITSSGSSEKIRSSMTLESASPGAMAPCSIAASRSSRRRSALRLALSAPWQEKQFSTRSGRMSRLKLTSPPFLPAVSAAVADPGEPVQIPEKQPRNAKAINDSSTIVDARARKRIRSPEYGP